MAFNLIKRSYFFSQRQINLSSFKHRKNLSCNNWSASSFLRVGHYDTSPVTSCRSSLNFCTNNQESNNPAILMSDHCVKRLKELLNLEERTFLRVLVEGGGCSGFQYKFDIDTSLNDDDQIFENDGAKIVVDEISLEYIKGSTIDYQKELIRSAFRIINNPIAESGCSCGASFSIKI